jgi:signal transduction histidine kinase
MQVVIFSSLTALTVIIVFFFGQSLENSYNEKALDLKVTTVENQCMLIANQIVSVNFLINDSTNSVSTQIDQLAISLGGRIVVMNKNYRILKDTFTGYQGKYFISRDVLKIMKGTKTKVINYPDGYMELIIPIVYENSKSEEVLGAVIATISMDDLVATKNEIRAQRMLLSVAFMIIGISLAACISIYLTKDFKKINKNLKYIAMGHEDELVEELGYTEMKELVKLFNAILSKMHKLEDSRQEFVSNVSHELKTPMTSMKVLADSLLAQEGMPEEAYREFLTDIVAEIDRENDIITDLLSLVKMDKKVAKLDIKTTSVNELLEVILKRLKPLAQQRNIEIIFESFRPVTAEIDQVKLSLAFNNLIENAIKYNRDDGWIRVSLNADHKYFYVKVADSGVGIPKDCQDQVFERFYRVDKARSRKTGGTGLGLSITRNAILVHKGAIKLYSEEGEGTTFTVRIPLSYHA